MKRFRTVLTCSIIVVMVTSMLAGCGGASKPPQAPASSAPASPGTASSSTSTLSSFDQLMATKDRLPLSGIQPLQLESRKNIEKALPKAPKKNITIGWSGAFLGAPFFVQMMDTANATAQKYGYKMNYQNANFDIQKQFTHIDTFITQKVDVIVINAVDINASVQYMKRAVQAGIPVIITGPTDAKDEYPIVTTFISGAFDPGFEVGVYTAQKMYKQGKTLKLGFSLSNVTDAASNSRPAGFISGYLYESHKMAGKAYADKWDAVLDGYNLWVKFRDKGSLKDEANGIDLVGYGQGGGTDPAAGQKASSDLLTAHPDMNVLFVEQDSQLLGVMKEMKQHNLVPGKDMQLVCAADGTKEGMDYIKEGTLLATALNTPDYDGASVVELIHKIFEGNFDASNMPANSYTPTAAITKENIDMFYNPNTAFANPIPWDIQTIDQHNAKNKK